MESKTPRTDRLRIVLGLNKCIENGDASVGHVMALLNHAETLESDLAARDARIAELEVGLRKNDARWAQHMAVMEEGDENPLTLKLFESTAAEYQAAIDAAIAAKESK